MFLRPAELEPQGVAGEAMGWKPPRGSCAQVEVPWGRRLKVCAGSAEDSGPAAPTAVM